MPTSGAVKGVKITGGTLQLSELGERVEWLTIDLAAAGPLQDMLEIIDAKPLRYAHAVGLDPTRVAGRAESQVHFVLPLLAELKLDSVDYRGEAIALLDLKGASLAIPEAGWKKPPDQPATAKITLDIENERIAQIPQIEVRAPGLDGRLAIQLTADRRQVERVDIQRFVVG